MKIKIFDFDTDIKKEDKTQLYYVRKKCSAQGWERQKIVFDTYIFIAKVLVSYVFIIKLCVLQETIWRVFLLS